jgi:hypothetical protein
VTLTCIECGVTSEVGEGWKAEVAVDLLDEEEPDEVGGRLLAGVLDAAATPERHGGVSGTEGG